MNIYQIILIVIFNIFLFSCKTDIKEEIKINPSKVRKESVVSVSMESKEDTTKYRKFSTILIKLENNKELVPQEYIVLLDSLFKVSDESQSEQNGYLIFTYLKNNEVRNRIINSLLEAKSNIEKENIKESLVELMCIDIIDEGYDSEKFIMDFQLFKKSKKAKSAFNNCMENKDL